MCWTIAKVVLDLRLMICFSFGQQDQPENQTLPFCASRN
jgi:hypothetical protein